MWVSLEVILGFRPEFLEKNFLLAPIHSPLSGRPFGPSPKGAGEASRGGCAPALQSVGLRLDDPIFWRRGPMREGKSLAFRSCKDSH